MTGDGLPTAPERPTAARGDEGAVVPETAEQPAVTEDPGYALSAWSDHEHERLRRQAERARANPRSRTSSSYTATSATSSLTAARSTRSSDGWC